ncbi:MAG TPA: hypothetical protein ENK26_01705 [Gammaproteobacteria bacterium]|nr:hypothetical protein [Gammaproteobacteria bacterium]
MPVVNLSLTLMFAFFGYVSIAYPNELVHTRLGRALVTFMALFWLARAIQQAVFFRLRHWGSVAFLLFFLAGAALYAIPAFHD